MKDGSDLSVVMRGLEQARKDTRDANSRLMHIIPLVSDMESELAQARSYINHLERMIMAFDEASRQVMTGEMDRSSIMIERMAAQQVIESRPEGINYLPDNKGEPNRAEYAGRVDAVAIAWNREKHYGMGACQSESVKTRLAKWLASNLTGESSLFMVKTMLYPELNLGSTDEFDPAPYPRDISDFDRCVGLLIAIPEAVELLDKMRDVSDEWAAIVDNWDELKAIHLTEDRHAFKSKLKYVLVHLDQVGSGPR